MEKPWWTPLHSFDVYDLGSASELALVSSRYNPHQTDPFSEILSQALAMGAESLLVEYRYIDQDYRNEHSEFYSTTFRRYPSVAHRLHWFSALLAPEAVASNPLDALKQDEYLGYVIVRPVATRPVGRSVLQGKCTDSLTSCSASDTVNLFGQKLTIDGVPFMSQDSQLGICVHATAWMVAYFHHLRYGGLRLLPGDISQMSSQGLGRSVPAASLTLEQATAILEASDLPPIIYDVNDLPNGNTVEDVVKRYVDSDLPVIVAGGRHTSVVTGYVERFEKGKRTAFSLVRHDDIKGPYQELSCHQNDPYGSWEYLVIPLPKKLYISGEIAEEKALPHLTRSLIEIQPGDDEKVIFLEKLERLTDLHKELLEGLQTGAYSLRCIAMPSNEFKLGIRDVLPDAWLTSRYQLMQLPKWVWVVEIWDQRRFADGLPCVAGEAVLDATDHSDDPRLLAWRLPGRLYSLRPDADLEGAEKVGTIITEFGEMRELLRNGE